MSNSAWDEQIVVKGAGVPTGVYETVFKDVVRENKVVQYRSGLSGQKVIGKEYDSLDADQKAIVDGIPDEYWPQRPNDDAPRMKAAFIDQYRFIFTDPKTGTDLKFGAVFPVVQYSKDGTVISASNKGLVDFIIQATGAPIVAGDTFTVRDYIKPGDEFRLELVKNGNFTEIDKTSVVKKELAKPIVKGVEALSPKAKELLDFLKANYQGRPKRDVVDLYSTGQFGTLQETMSAWQEIMKNVPYSSDGKTLDFSEAV